MPSKPLIRILGTTAIAVALPHFAVADGVSEIDTSALGQEFSDVWVDKISADGTTLLVTGWLDVGGSMESRQYLMTLDGGYTSIDVACDLCVHSGLWQLNTDASIGLINGAIEADDGSGSTYHIGKSYLWSAANGISEFAVPTGYDWIEARALSDDASQVLVVATDFTTDGMGGFNMVPGSFLWSSGAGYTQIAAPSGTDYINLDASGMSFDGSVVFGAARRNMDSATWNYADEGFNQKGFIWNSTAGTQFIEVPVELDPAGDIFVENLSANGTTVSGSFQSWADVSHVTTSQMGFIWTAAHGFESIGILDSDIYTMSGVNGLSADGSVVLATSQADNDISIAYLWNRSGAPTIIDALSSGDSVYAWLLSEDGQVVAGNSGGQAFRWTAATGSTALPSLADGYQMSPMSMSADGSVIIGMAMPSTPPDPSAPPTAPRSWIWGASIAGGDTTGTTVDINSTQSTVTSSVSRQFSALAHHRASVSNFIRPRSVSLPHMRSPDSISTSSIGDTGIVLNNIRLQGGGIFDDTAGDGGYAGVALDATLPSGILGGLAFSVLNDTSANSEMQLDGSFNTIGAYLSGGDAVEGVGWSVALAHGAGDAVIQRDATLANTEAGQGTASLASTSLSFSLEKQQMLTPDSSVSYRFGVSHSLTKRGAYTEDNGIAFPISYEELNSSLTVGELELSYVKTVSDTWTTRTTGGVEFDISRDDMVINGSSSIPGLTDFSFNQSDVVNSSRLHVGVEASRSLEEGRSFTVGFDLKQSAYAETPIAELAVSYNLQF